MFGFDSFYKTHKCFYNWSTLYSNILKIIGLLHTITSVQPLLGFVECWSIKSTSPCASSSGCVRSSLAGAGWLVRLWLRSITPHDRLNVTRSSSNLISFWWRDLKIKVRSFGHCACLNWLTCKMIFEPFALTHIPNTNHKCAFVQQVWDTQQTYGNLPTKIQATFPLCWLSCQRERLSTLWYPDTWICWCVPLSHLFSGCTTG